MDEKQIQAFLDTIAQIESSGGKNFDHPEIEQGIHKGQRAAGRYGLMPNTTQEVLNRMRLQGNLSEDLKPLRKMKPDDLKEYVETHPETEDQLARFLANHVLKKQGGDEEKAAYSWQFGHNLEPADIEQRDYQKSDYVNKYRKYRGE